MTNVIRMPPTNHHYEEASRWIAKLDKGLAEEERAALQRWMAADTENQAVLLSMAHLWDNLDALSRLSDLFPDRPCRARGSWRPGAIAASVLCLLVGGAAALIYMHGPRPEPGQAHPAAVAWDAVYDTAIGEHSTINLPDGSQITLNTNSLVSVKYTAAQRLLTLKRGELHARVVGDPSRPLSVIAGNNVIEAIGTEFNIQITSDQRIELVVTEGKVRVGMREQAEVGADDTSALLSPETVTVAAGEELVLGLPDEELRKVSADDIEVKLSWRDGNLIFRGESLEDAVKEVGRYTAVEFVFLDDDLRKVRVAGLFKAGDVEGLLVALRENFDIVHQRVDDSRVLLDSQK